MIQYRFFRAHPAAYESVRQQIDQAWQYPTLLTATSIPPSRDQFHAPNGDCIIAVHTEWASWEPVASILPQLLAAGTVHELSEQQFWDLRPNAGFN